MSKSLYEVSWIERQEFKTYVLASDPEEAKRRVYEGERGEDYSLPEPTGYVETEGGLQGHIAIKLPSSSDKETPIRGVTYHQNTNEMGFNEPDDPPMFTV